MFYIIQDIMKLIVGLGNPGKQYKDTRHNVGFMFVDNVINKLSLKFSLDKALKCEILQTNINGEKVIFIKPMTYMNLSGDSVYLVANYYKINYEDILVIYDDLDLETGKIRIRPNGSSGGHKGIQSIINNLGTNNIKRVRIGIDKVSSDKTIDYVIGNFSKQDKEIIDISIEKGIDIVYDFISLPFEQVMSRYN